MVGGVCVPLVSAVLLPGTVLIVVNDLLLLLLLLLLLFYWDGPPSQSPNFLKLTFHHKTKPRKTFSVFFVKYFAFFLMKNGTEERKIVYRLRHVDVISSYLPVFCLAGNFAFRRLQRRLLAQKVKLCVAV